MEKFLSPGWKARPKAKPKGRPKVQAPEGAMTLDEMHRRLEALETIYAEASGTDEKVEKMMTLHNQAEEENKKLREELIKRNSV